MARKKRGLNRKTRKTIRKSMAAIFMITAIIVAAIPVPDIAAVDPPDGGDAAVDPVVAVEYPSQEDTVVDGNTIYGINTLIKKWTDFTVADSSVNATQDITLSGVDNPLLKFMDDSGNLRISGSLSSNQDANGNPALPVVDQADVDAYLEGSNVTGKVIRKAYTIQELSDGAYRLFWRYRYYSNVSSSTATICQYNNDSSPTNQQLTIERSIVQEYVTFTNMDLKDWYKDSNGDLYNVNGMVTLDAMSALKECFSGFTEDTEYEELLAKMVRDAGQDRLGTEEQIAFYRHFELGYEGNNYEHASAIDSRNSSNPSDKKVYIIREKGGQWLVESDAVTGTMSEILVEGIADEVFSKSRANYLKEVTLPAASKKIGNSAFENASSIQKITIENGVVFGHKAFKGCANLSEITIGAGITTIGIETFRGCSRLTKITLPNTVTQISVGAFAYCNALDTVDMQNISSEFTLGKFAFYTSANLNTVHFSTETVAIGDGAFAVHVSQAIPSGKWATVELPGNVKDLGDSIFDGRTSLVDITMPTNYGLRESTKKLDEKFFRGCTNLQRVLFPAGCVYASFDTRTFESVIDLEQFYVEGPGWLLIDPMKYAWPREAAHAAGVTYKFTDKTGTCYEVVMGGDIYQIRDNGDGTGVLSGFIKGKDADAGKHIVIPGKVGSLKVTSVVENCFEDVRNIMETLKISDDSLSSISDNAFKGYPKLNQVIIGNSITKIGAKAFNECESLTEVYFTGEGDMTIAPDAFIVGKADDGINTRLTIHGERLEESYAPFAYAMDHVPDPDSVTRICYKSNAPTCLTVIYDTNTGLNTLVEFPHYNDLNEDIRKKYEAQGNYDEIWPELKKEVTPDGSSAGIEAIDEDLLASADIAEAAEANLFVKADTANIEDSGQSYELYAGNKNEITAEPMDMLLAAAPGSKYQVTLVDGKITDSTHTNESLETEFSEGDTVYIKADDAPEGKVFDAWNVTNGTIGTFADANAQTSFIMPGEAVSLTATYKDEEAGTLSVAEQEALDATMNITLPSGIESIDVKQFFKDDAGKHHQYLGKDNQLYFDGGNIQNFYKPKSYYSHYMSTQGGGLFSANYEESDLDGVDLGTKPQGYDRLRNIKLEGVLKLPDRAFASCEYLESASIGVAEDLGSVPFIGCGRMTSMAGNQTFTEENGIIYKAEADSTKTIVECLQARGKNGLSLSALNKIPLDGDESISAVATIEPFAFYDCNAISSFDLTGLKKLTAIPESFLEFANESGADENILSLVDLPEGVNFIGKNAFKGREHGNFYIKGKEVTIKDGAFDKGKLAITIWTYDNTAAYRYGLGNGNTVNIIGEIFLVMFYDHDGKVLATESVKDGEYVTTPPPNPTRTGYTFTGWSFDFKGTPITSDTVILAQYKADGSGGSGDNGGNGGNGNGGNGNGGDDNNGSSNSRTKYDVTVSKGKGDGEYRKGKTVVIEANEPDKGKVFHRWETTSSDVYFEDEEDMDTSFEMPGHDVFVRATYIDKDTVLYNVVVEGGTGSGSYPEDRTVAITANAPPTGKIFDKWTSDNDSVEFASVNSMATSFTMPPKAVKITANYKDGSASGSTASGNDSTGNSSGGGNSGSQTSNNSGAAGGGAGTASDNIEDGTRVSMSHSGFANTDKASASVSGSNDEFLVRVTENAETTELVKQALTNEYGSLDNIEYVAMDISLYDPQGSQKITDTEGLEVTITLPLATNLISFGGNTKAASVQNEQLERLGTKFKTIDGVECVEFTATHFSPYTLYVDKANLTEGTLDSTPPTGDGIHPKWFLALGLASISIVFFLKKDKVKVA